ncbi:TPA: hypothetical protein MDA43_002828 [Escherichia coli]|nr:hypothetical protein [Escherichia coli]
MAMFLTLVAELRSATTDAAGTATLTATKSGNTLVGTVWASAEAGDACVCVRLGY